MSTSKQPILLKGGTVILHEPPASGYQSQTTKVPSTAKAAHTTIQWIRGDLLIIPPRISKIVPCSTDGSSPNLELPPHTRIVDCRDKIVSPGFVDTHHHVWQTQLKGRHADEMLQDYFYSGNFTSSIFTPRDVYWGQLGGCLGALDSGTTTLVDHSHINYSVQHSSNALSATVASGIRSFFCYCPTPRVKTWAPSFQLEQDLLPEWVMSQLEELAHHQPFGDGRVRLGFAFDGFYLPEKKIQEIFAKVRGLGIKLITSHYLRTAVTGNDERPKQMESLGILKDDILLSHANQATPNDAQLLKAAGAFISSTPDTELQMGSGEPTCFRPDLQEISSLGIDCHSNNSSDIMTQMRLALQSSRAIRNQRFIEAGKAAKHASPTVEEAFNLGTIQGARAVRMEDEIGSLAEGKLADIVIFDATTPAMVCAAQHDPVAAIVQHASVRDIDTVIVNGQIRKEGGNLLPIAVESEAAGSETRPDIVKWQDLARELLASRSRIQEQIEQLDFDVARQGTLKSFYIDENNLVETI
ncbi:MAG: hypothetical protein M4579_001641 [Chaenotheca gracillima]|nr:MAG: hypothetical protein M4579_001641 [Chaenotheca gracillima]